MSKNVLGMSMQLTQLKSPNSQLATLYNVIHSMHMLMQLIQRKDFIKIDLFLMLMQSMHYVHNINIYLMVYMMMQSIQSNYNVNSNTKYMKL